MTGLAVDFGSELPTSWIVAAIQEVAEISPKLDVSYLDDDHLVHFVPMAAVAEDFGGLDSSQLRPIREVRKGYTVFSEGDVLFAKITPCMENGKGAIVPSLPHVHAFGSTEFHVLRPGGAIANKWLAYYLSQPDFRRVARQNMTGTAGQLRVPTTWLSSAGVPLPPRAEQTRIVEKLEELLSDLDAGVAELKAAQRKLTQYRQSLLKAAVEGTLTADWRMVHGKPPETGAELLQRILSERRGRWEQKQLAKFAEQGKAPPKGWQTKYPEPVAPDIAELTVLPNDWAWASVDQLTEFVTSGSRGWAEYYSNTGATFIRSQDINKDRLDISDAAFVNPPANSEGARTRVQRDDLLLTITGANVGKSARVEVDLDEAYVSQHVALIRLIDEGLSAYLHLFLICEAGGRGQLDKMAYGAGKPGLNLRQVLSVAVPVPNPQERSQVLDKITTALDAAMAQIQAVERGIRQSAAQRKNLLKAAFAGQLVPQDPNDEPASELLARIRAEREQSPVTRARRRAGANPAPATKSPAAAKRGRKPRLHA